mgnify:CR=1 FL=1
MCRLADLVVARCVCVGGGGSGVMKCFTQNVWYAVNLVLVVTCKKVAATSCLLPITKKGMVVVGHKCWARGMVVGCLPVVMGRRGGGGEGLHPAYAVTSANCGSVVARNGRVSERGVVILWLLLWHWHQYGIVTAGKRVITVSACCVK